jgi:hypothetical protein
MPLMRLRPRGDDEQASRSTLIYYAHWLPSENDARYLGRLSAPRDTLLVT